MGAATTGDAPSHVPVLIDAILKAVEPVKGHWLDGTFGAGGYTRALLDAGAEKVTAVDRDPLVFDMAGAWVAAYGARLVLQRGVFSKLDTYVDAVDGVVLDLGVSSMQLDQPDRGFSFTKDGPLDMRMGQKGLSAADLVNGASEKALADFLFHYGEERASRRIARAIVRRRAAAPITRTLELAEVIESCLPRAKPGQSHPATRSFQALRIAVNDEYRELFEGLMASERALAPTGMLAVVTFHSIEDRMVKRYLAQRAGKSGNVNRFAPDVERPSPAFNLLTRKAIAASPEEIIANPRARSAKLRVAQRTDAPADAIEAKSIGMPIVEERI
ncbi:MAG: 16S rRNA (cytosine(1402)-N(4))-methyltransferase RsmH [Pseudomonadota bacterium]